MPKQQKSVNKVVFWRILIVYHSVFMHDALCPGVRLSVCHNLVPNQAQVR